VSKRNILESLHGLLVSVSHYKSCGSGIPSVTSWSIKNLRSSWWVFQTDFIAEFSSMHWHWCFGNRNARSRSIKHFCLWRMEDASSSHLSWRFFRINGTCLLRLMSVTLLWMHQIKQMNLMAYNTLHTGWK